MATNKLRIVHCVRSPIGGIFRHIRDLAECQIKAGHDVGLICDSSTGSAYDNRLLDDLRPHMSLGVERFPMKRQLSLGDLKAAFSLYRHVRDLNPDILHGHGAKGGAYSRVIGTILRIKGSDTKRIYTPHGGSLHYDPNRMEGRIYHALERGLITLSDGLIFVSDYEYSAFETKVTSPHVPVRIVYNGLKASEFTPVKANSDAADFLFIGMLRDLKGTDLFIEALNNIRLTTGTAPSAAIVGEGPDETRYRAMVERLGLQDTVRFYGAMPSRDAFAMAKTVVVPSRAEAMPYIVLEAIAAQRPLIATRVGGIPEIFGKHVDRLIEPGRVGRLTQAMTEALQHPETMLPATESLSSTLAETFSTDLMSDRITSLYHELLGNPVACNDSQNLEENSTVLPEPTSFIAKAK